MPFPIPPAIFLSPVARYRRERTPMNHERKAQEPPSRPPMGIHLSPSLSSTVAVASRGSASQWLWRPAADRCRGIPAPTPPRPHLQILRVFLRDLPVLRVSLHQKAPNNPTLPPPLPWRLGGSTLLKIHQPQLLSLPLRPPRLLVSLHPKKFPPINHPARKIKPQMNADSRRFWKSSAHRNIHPVGQCSCSHKSFKINVHLCSSAVHFLSSTLNLSSASSSATSPFSAFRFTSKNPHQPQLSNLISLGDLAVQPS